MNDENKPTLGMVASEGVYLGDLFCLRSQVTRRIFQLLSYRSREDKRYYSAACPGYKASKAEDYQPK